MLAQATTTEWFFLFFFSGIPQCWAPRRVRLVDGLGVVFLLKLQKSTNVSSRNCTCKCPQFISLSSGDIYSLVGVSSSLRNSPCARNRERSLLCALRSLQMTKTLHFGNIGTKRFPENHMMIFMPYVEVFLYHVTIEWWQLLPLRNKSLVVKTSLRPTTRLTKGVFRCVGRGVMSYNRLSYSCHKALFHTEKKKIPDLFFF